MSANKSTIEKINNNLAQFKNAIGEVFHHNISPEYIEWLFKRTDSIDKCVSSTEFVSLNHPNLIGDSPVHLALKHYNVIDIILNKEISIKSEGSITAIVKEHYDDLNIFSDPRYELPYSIIRSMLDMYKDTTNVLNPSDKYGLSHFHIACMVNHVELVKFYLTKGVDIDHIVSRNSPYFPGYTPLHFAVKCCSVQTVKLLLESNSLFYIRDDIKMTPMHILLKNYYDFTIKSRKRIVLRDMDAFYNMKHGERIAGKNESDLLTPDCYAEDYLKLKCAEMMKLFVNRYRSEDMHMVYRYSGLTYFHLAATIGGEALDIIERPKDINTDIDWYQPVFSGYTPLHFAAFFTDIITVAKLVKKGGDLGIKNFVGIASIDICADRFKAEDISRVVSLNPIWREMVFSDGNTKLVDMIFEMRHLEYDGSRAASIYGFFDDERLQMNWPQSLEIYIPGMSPMWSGLPLIHMAICFSKNIENIPNPPFYQNMKVIDELYEGPKTFYIQSYGIPTPLHFAYRRQKIPMILKLLSLYESLENYVVQGTIKQLTCLHVACALEGTSEVAKKLISLGYNVNAVYQGEKIDLVEPNWTPLHIVISQYKHSLALLLAENGADPLAVDAVGMTPIHLAFIYSNEDVFKEQESIVSYMFTSANYSETVASSSSLSHLHVACYFGNETAVNSLISKGSDINRIIKYEITEDDKSYLPSRLLKYTGSTPLYLALKQQEMGIVKVLLENGAEIFLTNDHYKKWLLFDLLNKPIRDSDKLFLSMLNRSEAMQKRSEQEIGLTKLHIACRLANVGLVEALLDKGANVNERISEESRFWPGYTPLHTLDYYATSQITLSNVQKVLRLLLDRQANVTLLNVEGKSPIHMAYYRTHFDSSCKSEAHASYLFAKQLLHAQEDFSVNPTTADGVSHFHIACEFNDVDIIRKFLNYMENIDVNQRIESFLVSDRYLAGCTPLHLAVRQRSSDATTHRLEIINLLLQRGANVNSEDTYGNTPLLKAVECNENCQDLVERLAIAGANVNIKNIFGKSPLELLVTAKCATDGDLMNVSVEEIKNFLRYGSHFNDYNLLIGKGYIALTLSHLSCQEMQNLLTTVQLNYPEIMGVKHKGRTPIHNIVSANVPRITVKEYATLIDRLTRFGRHVDEQDKEGKTALHLATGHQNINAVAALLLCGADPSIVDSDNQVAFSYNPKVCSRCSIIDACYAHDPEFFYPQLLTAMAEPKKCLHVRIDVIFFTYGLKILSCGLHLKFVDNDSGLETLKSLDYRVFFSSNFYIQLEEIRNIKIEYCTVTFGDFLIPNGIAIKYARMPLKSRTGIDDIFSVDNVVKYRERFCEVMSVIQFQYRYAVKRYYLLKAARKFLITMSGYDLPDDCSDYILQLLTNYDLSRLITGAFQAQKELSKSSSNNV